MPFFPLGIILFGKINKNINISTILILFFVSCMMIGQPILAGPDYSGRNVVRIATLCYPILLTLLFYAFNPSYLTSRKYLYYPFIFCLFVWSLHPTFSIINFFSILRF